MNTPKRNLSIIGVVLSLLWLAACSPAVPTSSSTPNLNPFRTEVAATVLAQVTQALALTPSVTPLSSPASSASPTSTNLPSLTPNLTTSPTPNTTVTQASGTPTVATENHAQWVSQNIADDTIFAPGAAFTMTWHLKNTGTSTWTAGYMLRYYSGNAFGAPKEITIGQEVLPGGEIDISLQMKAPATPGVFISDWVMSNGNRANFKEPVYLQIKVAIPATSTPTPKP